MRKERVPKRQAIAIPHVHEIEFGKFFVAFLVLLVQLLLPLSPLFAFEDSAPAETVEAPSESVSSPTSDAPVVDESVEEITPPVSEIVDSTSPESPAETGDPSVSEDITTSDDAAPEIVPDPSEPSTDPTEVAPDPLVEGISTTSPDEEEGTTTIITDEPLPPVVPEEEIVDLTVVDEPLPESTTTEPVVVEEAHTVTNDENRFTFGVNDCAQVADGSFYCKKAEEEPVVIESDRVFAGPDQDGDNEIFIEKEGELTQLTHNTLEDEAPYFDAESNTIVWHRLIDERYQIVSYDVEKGEETVLTHDHYNNMQPTRVGGITVWQGWVGNDWEILMMEGNDVQMITDNTVHDIGPRINGDYIIWQAEEPDGWKVRVYNRLTKETETISDASGASIENPRLVLLYDAKQENGDIETRGYDLVSGETVPLGATPGNIPESIPDPDQTGEDRALITGSTQLKTKSEDEGDSSVGDASSTPPIIGGGNDPDDVVIPAFDGDIGSTTPIYEDATSTATSSLDLVVEPLPIIETTPPMEDLVVPAYEPTLSDSQEEVATSS